jgi:hypothetical protein
MTAVEKQLLEYVQEGMKVYDHEGAKIGKVSLVFSGAYEYLPQNKALAIMELDESLLPDAVRDLFPPDRVPAEVRERLFQMGFIKIDTGIFGSDRYVLGNQIASIRSDSVHLTINKSEALRF